MIDYTEIRADAHESIKEAGQPGFIRRKSVIPGADPWDPGTSSPTTYPVWFVLLDYQQRDRDGTLIEQDDQKALISAQGLTITPTKGDELLDRKNARWEIVSIKPLSPAGVDIIYTAQVRK